MCNNIYPPTWQKIHADLPEGHQNYRKDRDETSCKNTLNFNEAYHAQV